MTDPYIAAVAERIVLGAAAEVGGAAVAGVGAVLGAADLAYRSGRYIYNRMKRPRTDNTMRIDNNMIPDDVKFAAGSVTNRNRVQNKRVLKRGRVGRKLLAETSNYVQRWQRVFHFGSSSNPAAYPASNESVNPGSLRSTWNPKNPATHGFDLDTIGTTTPGRFVLTHSAPHTYAAKDANYEAVTNWSLLPAYLFDLTTWRIAFASGRESEPQPMKRLAADNLGNFRWIACAQPNNSDVNKVEQFSWLGESSPDAPTANLNTSLLPPNPESKSLLSWSDIRLMFVGSTQSCVKIHLELVQFVDPMYQFNFHPDGEPIANMTEIERSKVNSFWNNEVKRLVYTPMVVNQFSRKQAIRVLYSETFCINADSTINETVDTATVYKQIFKRFNRLCRWDWTAPLATALGTEVNIESSQYQTKNGNLFKPYCDPKARIFLYIRSEAFDGRDAGAAMTDIPTQNISFDIIVRNKWRVMD